MDTRAAHRFSAACALGFFLYGAGALLTQLLCLQELLLLFCAHELFLGFSLAAWMGWVGAGSWLARRMPSTHLAALLRAASLLLLANLALIRLSKGLFGFGMLVGLLPMLLLTTLLLAPIGLMTGALFSWGYDWCHARSSFSLGRAYLWDALGAAVGGLLYTWLLAGRLAPEWLVVLLAIPSAVLAWLVAPHRWRSTMILTLGVSLCVAISPLPRLTRALQWRGYSLIAERTSRYSHLALARTGSLVSLFENGVISAHFPDPAAYEALVHWPLLVHPAPRRVLIIGGAATGSLVELLQHPVTRIDYVELDPTLVRLVESALSPRDREALADARVRLIHRDGRRWLTDTPEQYDVILLQLPEPLNAQINRFYTLEVFRLMRRRLAPGGVVAFAVPSSENYLSDETAYFNACLYQTLQAAFPHVELVAGDPLLFLAGQEELRLEPSLLTQRYAERRLSTREVVPSLFPILLDPARRQAVLTRLTSVRVSLLNRDFVPVCYSFAWRVWLSKFVSPAYFLSVLVLLVLIGWCLRIAWRRRALLLRHQGAVAVYALGAAGMVYETVLLLAFQALHGYVYWQLGSLFAAVMLGLALGSALAVRLDAASLPQERLTRWLRVLLIAMGLEGMFLVVILPTFQRLPAQVPWLLPFGLLLLLSGCWLGVAFPLAGRLATSPESPQVAGLLYAADLWGAALGAVLTSALLVPLIGLIPTLGVASLMLLGTAWLLLRR